MSQPEVVNLTAEQIAHYRSDGWIAPIDLFDEAEAARLADELAAAEAAHPNELHAEHRNNAHLAFPFLAELALHATIVDAVTQLVGDDVGLSSTVLFIKAPMSGSYVSWHQDAMYMAMEPDNFVTAWVALTASTVESGCVTVIPGSHRARATHVDTFAEDNILTRGQRVADVDDSHAVNLVLRPGQMSLHHPWLIHGSRPNQTDGRRIGIAMQSYFGSDVRPTRGEHHCMHVRGKPLDASFVPVPRPATTCDASAVAVRAAANQAFADVLYEGAEVRRQL